MPPTPSDLTAAERKAMDDDRKLLVKLKADLVSLTEDLAAAKLRADVADERARRLAKENTDLRVTIGTLKADVKSARDDADRAIRNALVDVRTAEREANAFRRRAEAAEHRLTRIQRILLPAAEVTS